MKGFIAIKSKQFYRSLRRHFKRLAASGRLHRGHHDPKTLNAASTGSQRFPILAHRRCKLDQLGRAVGHGWLDQRDGLDLSLQMYIF